MRLGVIKAYMAKEFTDLKRSKMIFLVYLLPVMILILFGYGIRLEVKEARTTIIDMDSSKLSRELCDSFIHSKYFEAKIKNIDYREALEEIKRAKTDIVIIVPPSFERDIAKGLKGEIGVFIDASFPLRGQVMQSYVEGVAFDLAKKLSPQKRPTIMVNQRLLFNQSLRDENAILPGLIALALLVAPAILAALLIVKEKEKGTIFNFYSSPVTKYEFLTAKLTPAFLLHSINIFIAFLIATYIFEVPFRGSFLLFLIASELYVATAVGIGLLVSIVTKTQIAATVLSMLITIIPSFLYSGMLMPISAMEGGSFIEAHLFPVMYYSHILYDTFLIGEGLGSSKNIIYLVALAAYALILMIAGSYLLKKEL